jgi:putative tryptophan/tyrosine transport system substrate-binding protein
MRRREFITLLGGAASAWPLAARAQKTMPVIGNAATNLKSAEAFLAGVRRGLAELGYVEGENFRFELREANYDGLPIMFGELVDQKVTVILATTTLQLEAAKAATQSIPIVFVIGSDPVERGFVASLNRPGGNITGVFNLNTPMTGKRIEVLRELVPSLTKFAFLTIPREVTVSKNETREAQAAADLLGLNLLIVNAFNLDEVEAAFETSVREGAGGVVVGTNGQFYGIPKQFAALTARYSLPAIYWEDRPVREGGLVSYGVDVEAAQRLVANYVGRILKGEKPADIPVQQATKTKLVINLKTAKAMGITVPTLLLGRADEIIE